MSLYNRLFGVNEHADVLLESLGLTREDVPRFRDCYMDNYLDIVIFTRTGGGNRVDYATAIDILRLTPGYLRDEDARFDTTFANFYFQVPASIADMAEQILEDQGAQRPNGKLPKTDRGYGLREGHSRGGQS